MPVCFFVLKFPIKLSTFGRSCASISLTLADPEQKKTRRRRWRGEVYYVFILAARSQRNG